MLSVSRSLFRVQPQSLFSVREPFRRCVPQMFTYRTSLYSYSTESQWEDEFDISPAKLTVVGVGGAGSNTVDNMVRRQLAGVKCFACNTDAQALRQSLVPAEQKIQIGKKVTSGLGAGSKPQVGKAAVEEELPLLLEMIGDTDMVFLTAGMGGGTGTGAGPVIGNALREKGILTIGIVTKPFRLEGPRRMRIAEEGLLEMQQSVDTLIVIPNEKVLGLGQPKLSFKDSLELVNNVLYDGVRAVTDVIVNPGLINLDFADVRTITRGPGWGLMGTGTASGNERARIAANFALNNPLLCDIDKRTATGILVSITGGSDLKLLEIDEIVQAVQDSASSEANIIFGATTDQREDQSLQVSLIMTGPWSDSPRELEPGAAKASKPASAASSTVSASPSEEKEKEKPTSPKNDPSNFWNRWFGEEKA